MTDLSRWPYNLRSGKRARKNMTIPNLWLNQFRDDLEVIKREHAENDNHAIIQAVNEMADRIRKERENE